MQQNKTIQYMFIIFYYWLTLGIFGLLGYTPPFALNKGHADSQAQELEIQKLQNEI